MKKCTRCGEIKEFSDFSKRSKAPDGLTYWCKACFATHAREKWLNGDKERKERTRAARRQEVRENLWALLTSSQCKNCEESDPELLEFDHRDPEQKEFNISSMLSSYSWARILTETQKCDILCVRCHRKKTIRQLGLWRGMFAQ